MRPGQDTACRVSAAEARVNDGGEDTARVVSKGWTTSLPEENGSMEES